jgi:hypothetical protein
LCTSLWLGSCTWASTPADRGTIPGSSVAKRAGGVSPEEVVALPVGRSAGSSFFQSHCASDSAHLRHVPLAVSPSHLSCILHQLGRENMWAGGRRGRASSTGRNRGGVTHLSGSARRAGCEITSPVPLPDSQTIIRGRPDAFPFDPATCSTGRLAFIALDLDAAGSAPARVSTAHKLPPLSTSSTDIRTLRRRQVRQPCFDRLVVRDGGADADAGEVGDPKSIGWAERLEGPLKLSIVPNNCAEDGTSASSASSGFDVGVGGSSAGTRVNGAQWIVVVLDAKATIATTGE